MKIRSAGLASEQPPAKNGGSAELDGTHDGALVVGNRPLAAVELAELAEDVRDLELRSGHGESSNMESVEGTCDLEALGYDPEIDQGRLKGGMAKQLLDVAEVNAAFQEFGSEGVAKGMRCDVFLDTSGASNVLTCSLDG